MSEKKQQVILTRGTKAGVRRNVTADRAAELVAAGLAQYPRNSKAAKEQAAS